jgi:hypothetical protein
MCGSPPLLNMVLNIKHWQSQSEQDNILHVARCRYSVFGWRRGRADNWIIFSSFVHRSAKQGLDVEHTGSSIGAGKESLAELVSRCARLVAKLRTLPLPNR